LDSAARGKERKEDEASDKPEHGCLLKKKRATRAR
jgi:hypothetical protein